MADNRTPAQVVKAARETQKLSYRKMRDEINKHLPPERGISFNAIQAWQREIYLPPYYLFLYLRRHTDGWMREFAMDVLDALAAIEADVERRR